MSKRSYARNESARLPRFAMFTPLGEHVWWADDDAHCVDFASRPTRFHSLMSSLTTHIEQSGLLICSTRDSIHFVPPGGISPIVERPPVGPHDDRVKQTTRSRSHRSARGSRAVQHPAVRSLPVPEDLCLLLQLFRNGHELFQGGLQVVGDLLSQHVGSGQVMS